MSTVDMHTRDLPVLEGTLGCDCPDVAKTQGNIAAARQFSGRA